MASATGIPEGNPALEEQEPLLGRPGDATQLQGQRLPWNLVTGTGEFARTIRMIQSKPVHYLDLLTHLLPISRDPRSSRNMDPDRSGMGIGP